MTDLQVLLDARGATEQELHASASTLLSQVPAVEVMYPAQDQLADLTDRFGARVSRAERLQQNVPVLVASGRAYYAAGSVRRILAELATPGRSLTRILLPELPTAEGQVACWAPQWLAGYTGTPAELVDADLGFDREHLSHESPVARSWVRADDVGVTLASSVGEDPERWSRRTGRTLARHALVASVRAPVGAARRRLGRLRQRRRHAGPPHLAS